MRVRPTQRADLTRLTTIANDAFVDDELFSYLSPGGTRYPEAWRRYTAGRLKRRLVQPGIWGVVCVDDDDTILGYAQWARVVPKSMIDKRRSDRWLNINQTWSAYMELKLLDWAEKYEEFFKLNPSQDYAAHKRFASEEDDLLEPIDKVTPSWYLAGLGVAPEAQRRGVGSMLVDWGIERATEETQSTGLQVPITLTASVPGHGLYTKKGFRVIGWQKMCLEDKEHNWLGGAGFIWDPSNTWIKDAEDGSEVAPGRPINAVWTERTLTASAGEDVA